MDQPRLTLQSFQTFPQVSWVEGIFDRPVPFSSQPDRVAVGLYGLLARQGLMSGSLMLANDDQNFATMLPSQLGDAPNVTRSGEGSSWDGHRKGGRGSVRRMNKGSKDFHGVHAARDVVVGFFSTLAVSLLVLLGLQAIGFLI